MLLDIEMKMGIGLKKLGVKMANLYQIHPESLWLEVEVEVVEVETLIFEKKLAGQEK